MMRPTTAIYVRTNGDPPTTVKNHLKKRFYDESCG